MTGHQHMPSTVGGMERSGGMEREQAPRGDNGERGSRGWGKLVALVFAVAVVGSAAEAFAKASCGEGIGRERSSERACARDRACLAPRGP
ncbi:MAG: hypothetical protein RLZZ217_1835 [Planctomycetota bacterium]|jgi:hypothetical protein